MTPRHRLLCTLWLAAFFLAAFLGCSTTPSSTVDSEIHVVKDPRPLYSLLSWTVAGQSTRFALFRDDQRARLNDFLTASDQRRLAGVELAAAEEALRRLPQHSLVEWYVETDRHLILPSVDVIRHIRALVVRREGQLHILNLDDAEA